MRRIIGRVCAVGIPLWCAAGQFPRYALPDGDADARIMTGGVGTGVGYGDLNGDGRPDVAVSQRGDNLLRPELQIAFSQAARWPAVSDLAEAADVRYALRANERLLATLDLNGDGVDDLVLQDRDGLRLFWGRAAWPAESDASFADVEVRLPTLPILATEYVPTTAFGDVNGDGVVDFLFSWRDALDSGQNDAWVLWGRRDWPATLTPTEFVQGVPAAVADFDGDGRDDVWLNRPTGRDLIRGTPSPDDFWRSTPSLHIDSDVSLGLWCRFAGDRDGDGRPELVVSRQQNGVMSDALIDGTRLASTGAATYESLSPRTLLSGGPTLAAVGDFDGDRKMDFLVRETSPREAYRLFLAADDVGGALDPGRAAFTVETGAEAAEAVAGRSEFRDLDRDGRLDWILWQTNGFTAAPEQFQIFYGFPPLKNPAVAVASSDAASRRATLSLSVTGVPSAMRLGGDIADEDRDRWVPYVPRRRVQWTGAPGPKTVTAVFRLPEGRESVVAAAVWSPDESGPPLRVVTNRIVGGLGVIEVDCLVAGGRLRAAVFDRGGRRVRTLADGEASGWSTVRWDGRTDEGAPACPGVYTLRLDYDGRVERREAILER